MGVLFGKPRRVRSRRTQWRIQRQRLRWTLAEMATRVPCSVSHLGAVERGDVRGSDEFRERLEEVLREGD